MTLALLATSTVWALARFLELDMEEDVGAGWAYLMDVLFHQLLRLIGVAVAFATCTNDEAVGILLLGIPTTFIIVRVLQVAFGRNPLRRLTAYLR